MGTRRGGSNEYPQSMFWAELWKISEFLSEHFQFFEVKFSIYWNRRVFIMSLHNPHEETLTHWLTKLRLMKIQINAQADLNLRWAHMSLGTFSDVGSNGYEPVGSNNITIHVMQKSWPSRISDRLTQVFFLENICGLTFHAWNVKHFSWKN